MTRRSCGYSRSIASGLAVFTIALALGPESRGKAAATHHLRDVSALLAQVLEPSTVPGMVGGIVVGGDLVAAGAAGVRKRGRSEKVRVGDRFHIGSCTKSMTATLCAMLVEDGKLAWDRGVLDGLPDLAGTADAGWKAATLEALLTNRGGAPHDVPPDLWRALWRHEGTTLESRTFLARGILGSPPAYAPGSKYVYSNSNFVLAGAMAERATGSPWENLIREKLFRPLGMTTAGFGPPGSATEVDQPHGHPAGGKGVPPGPRADNPPALGPAGTVHCSIADWGKFVALHLLGARGRARLVSRESFLRLHRPAPGGPTKYAMGWLVTERPWAGGRVLQHSGSNTMWYAVTWIAPEKDFAVLVACNPGGDAAARACDDAAGALIRDHLARTASGDD